MTQVFGERAVEQAAEQFDLGSRAIFAARVHEAARQSASDPDALWDACRLQGRARLDELAQRVLPVATWKDLVLPEPQLALLRDIGARVRRARGCAGWGFRSRGARGLGVSVLFFGSSGTGKTVAAEVLANELRLDLFRVDLSQVVSKYIGETEKNLARVFDAAEDSGTILLFDEADALFGKRSEVKDSARSLRQHRSRATCSSEWRPTAGPGHSSHHQPSATALDTAFLRRLRVRGGSTFPLEGPDAVQRRAIWRASSRPPRRSRRSEICRLSRLNLAGGSIRNIALGSAFVAAEAGEPVRMQHIAAAVKREFGKQERSLPDDFRRP